MKTFESRVAVVTGAGSGIGRALSHELARRGAILALSDIDEAACRETAAGCDGRAKSVQRIDVAKREDVFAWADAVGRELGGVHAVFNNAGVALAGRLKKTSLEEFHWLMDINFWGVVHGSLAFLPWLERQEEAALVNVSSVFGIIAAPLNGTYNASKFAVRGFTEALRIELALDESPVAVTCVHPGGIRTNIARRSRIVAGDNLTAAEVEGEFDRMATTTHEACAKTILRAVARKAPRVLVGLDARLIDSVQRVAPTGYQRVVETVMRRKWRPAP